MEPLLKVRNLVKHYGKVKAVDDISFIVREGMCFGLLGPNGAGKTTTIEVMESIHKADSGEILYKGKKIDRKFKEQVGIQFQNTALQEFLTVRETLVLFSRLYTRHRPLDEIIKICSLDEIINRDNQKLSGGQRQRMLLGIAMISDPQILFLDEPTTGLDPQARRYFWKVIEDIKKENKTIILTTHYMDEAEYLCEEIVIMDRGKILESGEPKALLQKHFGGAVISLPEKDVNGGLDLDCTPVHKDGYLKIQCHDTDRTIQELIRKGIPLNGISVEKPNLDDLFIKLTGSSLDAVRNGTGGDDR
ncbi:MAG: ABC transporter ATP-binding protein [Spirochaetales bacterium]|nr:ABC transporter ATP-binding protein [Spirochaetales bacterium]